LPFARTAESVIFSVAVVRSAGRFGIFLLLEGGMDPRRRVKKIWLLEWC
jgi:hypothetical protein